MLAKTTPTPQPAFMRNMTPEKYQSMSKEDRRAYDQKASAWLKNLDAQIDRRNAENHKTLAFGIAQLVQLDPAVEMEIVRNYLKRENKAMFDKDFADSHPEFVAAMARFELEKRSRAQKAADLRNRRAQDRSGG